MAEPDSNETFSKARFKPGLNLPCQSAQIDKSVSITQTAKALPHARVLNCYKSRSEILKLRTELFCPLWAHERSAEKMRPSLIAMKKKVLEVRVFEVVVSVVMTLCLFAYAVCIAWLCSDLCSPISSSS